MNRYIPVDAAQRTVSAYLWILHPVRAIYPPVVEPTIVADEELVDVVVWPRFYPRNRAFPNLEHHVASLRTARTDGGRAIQLPGARLVEKILRQKRSYRAKVHDIPRPCVCGILSIEFSDQCTVAALADVEHRIVRNVIHEAYTPRTEYAAVRNVEHVSTEILDGVESLRISIARVGATLLESVILELALTRLIADGTVERMIDEQKLEHSLPGLEGPLSVHSHHLPLGDGGGARRRQLGSLLDFYQAHPAHAGHRESWMVAVVRNENASCLRRLEDRRALGHAHRPSLDRQVDRLRVCHQATCVSTE